MGNIETEHTDYEVYLQPTKLLDSDSVAIQQLIESKGWRTLPTKSAMVREAYNFIRDKIAYGFPESYSQSASKVLANGYGNSFSKSILMMALLRALDVPCRFHARTADSILLRGLVKGFMFSFMPSSSYHANIELFFNNKWLEMDGHIIDLPYLKQLQIQFPNYMGSFYGYGIAVLNFKNPTIDWQESDTYIQSKAYDADLGIYNDPDSFFKRYPNVDRFTNRFSYQHLFRNKVNAKIRKIRNN